MSKKPFLPLDAPLRHGDHPRNMSRRQMIGAGLRTGAAVIAGPSIFGLFASPMQAQAALSSDLEALKVACGIAVQGAGKIPFICFDLSGGANIAGSNVLVGGPGGQFDFLSTAGYSKLGIPGNMVPSITNTATGTTSFINSNFGLSFHIDSAFVRGMTERVGAANAAKINGVVLPARSENDTGNNPHNPMYAINRAGAKGSLLTLIGSVSSDSGGNSMAPAAMIDPANRPTKVDRPSDVTGLVDTGDLIGLLNQSDAVAVMESIERISNVKLGKVNTQITTDAVVKDLVRCGYVKAADIADRFGNPATLDPSLDPAIVGSTGIFSAAEFAADGEFRKTAAVMKLVMNGFAGAGTIQMGGFDYHTGDRATGELRDLRAGRCIGACLEYAARVGVPLMVYVFSDGSLSSNGSIDNSVNGRGKGVWTGDNQATASTFFLVHNPAGRATLRGANAAEQARHQQLGYMRSSADVETAATPAANNVNLLVETIVLNYMALHGEEGQFANVFPAHGLGPVSLRDSLTAFAPIVNGKIS